MTKLMAIPFEGRKLVVSIRHLENKRGVSRLILSIPGALFAKAFAVREYVSKRLGVEFGWGSEGFMQYDDEGQEVPYDHRTVNLSAGNGRYHWLLHYTPVST